MIYSLKQIGEYGLRNSKPLTLVEEQTEYFGDNYKNLFEIILDITDKNKIFFNKVNLSQIDPNKQYRYLYKSGSSRGSDITPCAKLTVLKKTFENKILKGAENNYKTSKENNFSEKEQVFFQSVFECIKKSKNDIIEQIEDIINSSDIDLSKDRGVLTIAFLEMDCKKYLGDFEIYKKIIELKIAKQYSFKHNTESKAENKVCNICRKKVSNVWGFVGIFPFYSVDKIGMVSSGFNQSNAWKNFPVCPECTRILEYGKKYLKENLEFRFYGFQYFILPTILTDNPEIQDYIFQKMKQYKEFSLSKTKSERNYRIEEKIFEYIQDVKNIVNYDFVFFKEEQSGKVFRILLNIKDISPSRFYKIVKIKKEIDNDKSKKFKIFEYISKKEIKRINFSFQLIKNIFPNNKFDGNFAKSFLEILNNILTAHKISQKFILQNAVRLIRKRFLNRENIFYPTLSLYKTLLFLDKIGVLDKKKGYDIMSENIDNIYQEFFIENLDFFDSNEKKAVFLEGVLCSNVLYIQRSERACGYGEEPFRKKLNGLKIDKRIIIKLLPEMINKINEYKRNTKTYSDLTKFISEYMLKSNFDKYSVDELSFYFTLGLNLAVKFINQKNNNIKETQDE